MIRQAHAASGRRVVMLIGMDFSKEERNLVGFEFEKQESAGAVIQGSGGG
jgi:hypothetical protein